MTIATQNTTVRPAAAQDWPHVVRLLEANGLAADDLKTPHDGYLLAWADGEPIGAAGADLYGNAALIRAVSVAKPHQGSGVGKQLLDRLIADLRDEGLARAYLFTVTSPEYFSQFKFKRMPHEQAPAALRASPEFERACSACTALMSLLLTDEAKGGKASVAAHEPPQQPAQQSATQASGCCAPSTTASTSSAPSATAASKTSCCGPAPTAASKPGQNKCCG